MSLIEKLLDVLNMTGEVKSTASVIISIGVILICGFLMTRLTKLLKLPNVTAYLIAGIIIGPSMINVVPQQFIDSTSFLGDIALAFIAFSVGEYFKIKDINKVGPKIVVITLMEALLAFVLTFVVCYFLIRLEFAFALVISSLASVTAPTSTIMTIKQTKAKGPFVNTLLEVVALDNAFSLILFSVAISISVALGNGGSVNASEIIMPIIYNIICLAIGIVFGFILKFLLPSRRTTDNRLIIVTALILLFCGVCALFGQSPLLGCMAIGTVYTNLTKNDDKIFAQVNYFIPPIMLVFFVRSGMKFNFADLTATHTGFVLPFFLIVIIYFFTRLIGKYSGGLLGSAIVRTPRNTSFYLGLGLLPQGSIAIALATSGARTLSSVGLGDASDALLTIILASVFMFELIGPPFTKLALYLSHSYETKLDNLVPEVEVNKQVLVTEGTSKEVETLVAQIQRISEEVGYLSEIEEAEEAFTEAAEEYHDNMHYRRNYRHFINKK